MTPADVDALIARLLDGRLAPAEAAALIAALGEPRWRARLREIADTEGMLLDELGRVRGAQRSPAGQRAQAQAQPMPRGRCRPLVAAAAAAALVVAAFAAAALVRGDGSGVDAAGPDAELRRGARTRPLAAGDALHGGDRLATAAGGAELRLGRGLACALAPRSAVRLRAVGERPDIVIERGAARLRLRSGSAGVATPHVTIALTAIELAIAVLDDRTIVDVHAGSQALGGLDLAAEESAVVAAGATARPLPRGRGLRVEFFAGKDLRTFAWSGIDATVDHDWTGTEPVPTLGGHDWSARWSGWLVPRVDGQHRLWLRVDDGARLWLDDRLVIDSWTVKGAATLAVDAELSAGVPRRLRIDYFQEIRQAALTLGWTTPDGLREAIPAECLRPPSFRSTAP